MPSLDIALFKIEQEEANLLHIIKFLLTNKYLDDTRRDPIKTLKLKATELVMIIGALHKKGPGGI